MTPEFFSSYGPFDGIKRDLWEGGTRVPTIARWPGRIPAGRVVAEPSAQWDWLPTFAELTGVPAPARADGVSLVPALTGKGAARSREFLYFEYQVAGRTPQFEGFEPGHRDRLRGHPSHALHDVRRHAVLTPVGCRDHTGRCAPEECPET